MPSSISGEHDSVPQWQIPYVSSPKRVQSDYRKVLLRKMSELNSSTNNQHQLAAGLATYENFCASDNNMPINQAKQSAHGQLRSRHMNGQAGGDSPLTPSSPGQWQDFQQNQNIRELVQELEERKRNETQLHQIIRMYRQQQQQQQQQVADHLDQINGPSLTPDGLPAAPSSDGIVESVKDGHIRRLGRDVTLLKAKLHETDARLSTAQREQSAAIQQLNSVKELLEKEKAENGTLKESLQRLSRENQCLKENLAVLGSRQPASLGTPSGGSSSVAGCSQELDYLHKVVDTLKATVQEQHAKLCSLRSLHDKSGQASSALSGPVRAQTFPVTSGSLGSRGTPASVPAGVRGPAEGDDVAPNEASSEWSVDGSTHQRDVLSRPANTVGAAPSTSTALSSSNISGASNNLSISSSRSNQAVQDEEAVNALQNIIQKLNLSESKPIPGVNTGRLGSEGRGSSNAPLENPSHFMDLSQGNNVNAGSQSRQNQALNANLLTANSSKSKWQAGGPLRPDLPPTLAFNHAAPVVATSTSGSRPLSRSEVIAVSSGLGRPSISRSSSIQAQSGALTSKGATVKDMLEALGGQPDPSLLNLAAMSTSGAGGVAASNVSGPRIPLMPGMVGSGSPSAAALPRLPQPQFVYEAEIDDVNTNMFSPTIAGGANFQQFQANCLPQQQRAVSSTSSSSFTPQPPPPAIPQRVQASTSSPLVTYQTASAAVTSDREGMHVLNKHMMVGGNMIYQQNPHLLLQNPNAPQIPIRTGSAVFPQQNSQNSTFTAEALSHHGTQQPPYTSTNIASPLLGSEHAVYSNATPHGQTIQQMVDPSGPRVNSERSCPVCGQDFSHVPMEDFQAHVYECFDEAGPETMKAPGEEGSVVGEISVADRSCPVCNAKFAPLVPQSEFERHVHSHFGEENFEIVS